MSLPRKIRSLSLIRALQFALAFAFPAALTLASTARADDPEWPRQFDSSSGPFVIYEPQPEQLNGDVLIGRAAFSLQKSGDANPTFGVLWFTERIEIDRDSSTVTARNFDVTKVRLPSITPDQASRYEGLVEAEAAKWDLSGSLEELQSGLAATEKERASVADLDNAPPRIIFSSQRSVLVVYDGKPALEPIEGTNIQRVANTPYAVVYDPDDHDYYLNGANLWYGARDPLGPWTDTPRPPAAVRAAVPPDTSSDDQAEGAPPLVLTATVPTELIATDGPPQYAPLVEDELLYVTNTESDVVREVSSQAIYVLLAGRWYRAASTAGPWEFVRGDQLPESFQHVPPDSPKGNILASVAGTDQADDAIADAEIPQTSAIQRSDHSFEVDYDGDPEFEPIEGTNLEYAVNTDAELILADGRYYACDQGVWYISDSPDGPWSVSDTRPVGVDDIPPECPVYDVHYVDIYDATPTVVYMGYLPGYLGCYPYYGTVVYGTGYRYTPWRSRRHYYPRPFTWGFHARYNPWLSRWSFGSSYSTGFLRVGSRWRQLHDTTQRRSRPRWFGPGGYHRPLVARDMALLRTRPARLRPRLTDHTPANVYNRSENIARVDRTAGTRFLRTVAPRVRPTQVPNDVFAGKDGKVYKRDDKGTWKVNVGREWKRTRVPITPPSPSSPTVRGSTGGRETKPSRPERPQPPDMPRERRTQPPDMPRERRTQPRDVAPPRPSQPRDNLPPRPEPPTIRPTPGDLEKEYHARERGQGTPSDGGGQNARPTPPPQTRQREAPPSERPAPPRKGNERDKDKSPSERRR